MSQYEDFENEEQKIWAFVLKDDGSYNWEYYHVDNAIAGK